MTDKVISLAERRPAVTEDVRTFLADLQRLVEEGGCNGFAYSLVRADGTTTHGVSKTANAILLLGSMAINHASLAIELDRVSADTAIPDA